MNGAKSDDMDALVAKLLRVSGVLRCLVEYVANEAQDDYALIETVDLAQELVQEAYELSDRINHG